MNGTPIPIDLVIVDETAAVHPAEIVRQDGRVAWVRTEAAPTEGTAVCLQGESVAQWQYGRVDGTWMHGVIVSVRGTTHSERRDFARVFGGITLLYQVAASSDDLTAKRWMESGEGAASEWHTPDPFMDFSGSGMRFQHVPNCKSGDMLLMEFKVPGSEEWHRAIGDVVRVLDIPEEQRDDEPYEDGLPIPTHWIAVHYRAIAASTVRSLLSFTERVQEASFEIA